MVFAFAAIMTGSMQVAAGGWHTVLLRSDGTAVAFGLSFHGQCTISPLEDGLTYMQVAAGEVHTVLLRSDGTAVAFGCLDDGRCVVPSLEAGRAYVPCILLGSRGRRIFQCLFDGDAITFTMLSGEPLCCIPAVAEDSLQQVLDQVTKDMQGQPFEFVSCSGWHLRDLLTSDAGATVSQLRQ